MATKAKKLEKVVDITKSELKVVENKVEPVKVEPAKSTSELKETVNVEEVVNPASEKKETVKAPAKKTTKASTAKKATKTVEKESTFEVESILQYESIEVSEKVLVEKVTDIWVNVLGKTKKSIKDIKLYIKPEEYSAYYVINGKEKGRIDL